MTKNQFIAMAVAAGHRPIEVAEALMGFFGFCPVCNAQLSEATIQPGQPCEGPEFRRYAIEQKLRDARKVRAMERLWDAMDDDDQEREIMISKMEE